MKWLYIDLRVGDPHHEPYREDPQGTRARIQKAVELMAKLAPDAEWRLDEDEDVSIVAPSSEDAQRILEEMGGHEEDTGWYWESPEVIGGYNIGAQESDYAASIYRDGLQPGLVVEEKTFEWLFTKLTEMGWI